MISFAVVYGGFVVLAPILAVCQRRWPAPEGVPSPWTARRRWDWAWWVITPMFTGVLTMLTSLWVVIGVAWAMGEPVCQAEGLAMRCTPLTVFEGTPAMWPLAVQAVVVFVLVDFLSYWSHRLRHQGPLWRLHALHHASPELDWLAAARLHPLDDLIDNTLVMTPILLLGFDHRLFLAIGPVLILHTLYLHAAVDWRLGRLGRVVVSPAFHRSHHAPGAEHNFGGVLAIWDWLFGTARAISVPMSASPDVRAL